MAFTASDLGWDRFGTSEHCIICTSSIFYTMHRPLTLSSIGPLLSVRMAISVILLAMLMVGEVMLLRRTDKVSPE